MDELLRDFVANLKLAYHSFGWWCIALIVATFLIMIGVNCFLKWIFRKTQSSTLRTLRKRLSTVCVYLVAMVVIYIYSIFDSSEKLDYNFGFVVSNAGPIAIAAMIIWWLCKFGWFGIRVLFGKLWRVGKNKFKELLEKIPLDPILREPLFKALDDYLTANSEAANLAIDKYIMANETNINRKIATMLTGLVDDSKEVAALTSKFLAVAKSKYVKGGNDNGNQNS